MQWELFGLARKYAEDRGLDASGDEAVGQQVLAALGGRCCTASRPTRASLADQLDWVAKLQLLEAYRDRHGLDWDDHRLAAVDLQYHDLRPRAVPVRPARHRAPGRPSRTCSTR